MNSQPTPEFMLSLVRQSYRASPGNFGYKYFLSRLWQELDKVGVPGVAKIPDQQRAVYGLYNYAGSSYELKVLSTEAYSKILRSGFVVEEPGDYFGVAPPSGDSFRWTARGQAWIDDAQPVPEDASAYMEYLRSTGSLDCVVEQYINEALVAFERGADFAAAVMVGAACEKLLYLLAEAMLQALASPAEQATLKKLFESRKITAVADFLRNKIETPKLFPYPVKEGAGAYWSAMVEAIRQQRNDAVHPMNAKASPRLRSLLPFCAARGGAGCGEAQRLAAPEPHQYLTIRLQPQLER